MSLRLLKGAVSRAAMPVICPVKNEQALLPPFIEHYRKLGVDQFIIIDNASSDGTLDYLTAQPDCRIYSTDQNYFESNFATDWINAIITREQLEGWLVYADVDEHLVYPDAESDGLHRYCEHLTRRGFDAAYAMMLDMYPSGSYLDVELNTAQPLTVAMPWFDTDYVLRPWPRRPWDVTPPEPKPQVLGGPRCRILSSLEREAKRAAMSYLLLNQVDRFVDYVPKRLVPTLARLWPLDVPALQKTPLNRARPGFRYFNSHTATNTRFSDELLVLLHFKFCSELRARFHMVQTQTNHYRRGLHYFQLQQALYRHSGSLLYEGSRRFLSSSDLIEVGLLGRAPSSVWTSDRPVMYRTGAPRQRALAG